MYVILAHDAVFIIYYVRDIYVSRKKKNATVYVQYKRNWLGTPAYYAMLVIQYWTDHKSLSDRFE